MTTTSLKERIKAKTAVEIELGPLDAAQPCLLGDKLRAKVASALEKERDRCVASSLSEGAMSI